MRIFQPGHFPPLLVLLCLHCTALYAQVDPIILQNDAQKRVVVSSVTTEGIPWAQYCEVANYSPGVAPTFVIGEIQLIRGADTTLIGWDHPLAGKPWQTQTVPVYRYNSLEYQNEVLTKPFLVRNGDVVKYFRDFSFRFPKVKADGTERTKADHIASAAVPDSLEFRVELLDYPTGAVLRTVFTSTLPPSNTWEQFSEHLLQLALDNQAGMNNQDFLSAFPVDSSLADRRVRLRVVPVSIPQQRGDFSTRALYAHFFLQPRVSLDLAAGAQETAALVIGAVDSTLRFIAQGKSAFGVQDVPRDASIAIFPTTVSLAAPVLTVKKSFIEDESECACTIADLNGRILHHATIPSGQTGGNHQITLPAEKFDAGYYMVLLRSSHRYNSTIIHVTN
jgi:hypothetical protein